MSGHKEEFYKLKRIRKEKSPEKVNDVETLSFSEKRPNQLFKK